MNEIKEKPKMKTPKTPGKTLRMPRLISGNTAKTLDQMDQSEKEYENELDASEQKAAEYGKEIAVQSYDNAKETINHVRTYMKDIREFGYEKQSENERNISDSHSNNAQRYTSKRIRDHLQETGEKDVLHDPTQTSENIPRSPNSIREKQGTEERTVIKG